MATNRGKQFESKFKLDWQAAFPDGEIDRLVDSVSGYKAITNVCDFIGYNFPNMFYLECKSCLGNTFPLSNLTQYDKLKEKVGKKGIRTGVVLWMIDHDVVLYVPISTIMQMKADGKKSVNIKMLQAADYKIIQIPSEKKRVFLDSDYTVLMQLEDGD